MTADELLISDWSSDLCSSVLSRGDVDIVTDDLARCHFDAVQKFIAPGPQNLVHRLVQPRKGPALGQPSLYQAIDLGPSLVHTGNDVVEEITLRIGIGNVLDCLAETMFVKFMQQDRERRALHILLIKRLNRGKAGG